ncbi:hypothetical protein N6B72_13780 [Chryseobacterium soli]|uniref:hypothetical protein n=1 Tax=Chryseobacterium soli TaxID=445961 RepID=UPI00295549E7|nr:hypothetical protein [Chryseobacterium soli]MDV7697991.1 hypothetical protein [Chryseobacterium soli]
MKKLLFLSFIIWGIIFWLGKTIFLFENLWRKTTDRNYIIPDESSLLKFRATKMNQGSGDGWLYGEDENYYYSTKTGEKNPRYIKFLKKDTSQFRNFNRFQIVTWRKNCFKKLIDN